MSIDSELWIEFVISSLISPAIFPLYPLSAKMMSVVSTLTTEWIGFAGSPFLETL